MQPVYAEEKQLPRKKFSFSHGKSIKWNETLPKNEHTAYITLGEQ